MESFEQFAKQYEPMIHKIIRALHIYKNQDQFYQTGLIGLWEAKDLFDKRKGNFTNYAYTYIKGKILTEMFRENKRNDRYIVPKEEYWETIEDSESQQPLEAELLLSYCQNLTEKETKWVVAACLDDISVRQLAEKEKVTLSAVKQWRSSALRKLRGSLH
ncbi:sigma-70 family RNA polymerase sigma factor [Neobacillus sp. FSL H8-0543]|uniref:sigma-70 family RNA polymerase sigma factor n=1 Tax=Neobacillus sp. FSL H8-0543 TaxID=2954672 RepID=UPI003158EDFD